MQARVIYATYVRLALTLLQRSDRHPWGVTSSFIETLISALTGLLALIKAANFSVISWVNIRFFSVLHGCMRRVIWRKLACLVYSYLAFFIVTWQHYCKSVHLNFWKKINEAANGSCRVPKSIFCFVHQHRAAVPTACRPVSLFKWRHNLCNCSSSLKPQ